MTHSNPIFSSAGWRVTLIVLALVMAVIYNAMCNAAEARLNK